MEYNDDAKTRECVKILFKFIINLFFVIIICYLNYNDSLPSTVPYIINGFIHL